MNYPVKLPHASSPEVLQTLLDEARRELAEARAKIERQATRISDMEQRLQRHPWEDDTRLTRHFEVKG